MAPDPSRYNSGLKNAWRFAGLAYVLVISFVVVGFTARYWLPVESGLGGAILLGAGLLFIVLIAFMFSLTSVGWALWSLRYQQVGERRRFVVALGVSLLTAILLGSYMLVLLGVVRLN